MVRSARATLVVVALTTAMLVALTGCGGGGGGGDTPSKSPAGASGSTAGTASGTASDTTTSPAPQSGPAEQQIRQNWEKFFASATTIDEKAKLLENGGQLGMLLQAFSGDPRVGQVRAKVSQVHLTSATAAEVTYTLSLEGNDVLPNTLGTSVLQDQVWKVSVKSLCALIALDSGGTPAPGC